MIKIFLFCIFLIFSVNGHACPDLSGIYYDQEEDVNLEIWQENCEFSVWDDGLSKSELITDGIERILDEKNDMKAYAKIYYQNNEMVMDIRMNWGKYEDWGFPSRWFTTYRIDKFNNLVRKIISYDKDGNSGATEYITYRRVR